MILNHNRLTLVKFETYGYTFTWEKFDPVDFKTTFVLYESQFYKSFLYQNTKSNYTLTLQLNEILKDINAK